MVVLLSSWGGGERGCPLWHLRSPSALPAATGEAGASDSLDVGDHAVTSLPLTVARVELPQHQAPAVELASRLKAHFGSEMCG